MSKAGERQRMNPAQRRELLQEVRRLGAAARQKLSDSQPQEPHYVTYARRVVARYDKQSGRRFHAAAMKIADRQQLAHQACLFAAETDAGVTAVAKFRAWTMSRPSRARG